MKFQGTAPLKPSANPPVVYFAHSMRIYGTPEAAIAKATIAQLIPEGTIFDPEILPWSDLVKQSSNAAVFDAVIRASTRVVIYEHQGHIGRGIAKEVEYAQRYERPIHVLRDLGTAPKLLAVRGWVSIDPRDWKVRYGRLLMG